MAKAHSYHINFTSQLGDSVNLRDELLRLVPCGVVGSGAHIDCQVVYHLTGIELQYWDRGL